MKPDPNVNHPDDDRDLREAEQTIGDYKLKIDSNFDASEEDRSTTLRKIKEILTVREEVRMHCFKSVSVSSHLHFS